VTTTNLNRWEPWYATATEPMPYGDEAAYRVAAEWLDGLPVEDWGCGYGWYGQLHRGPYIGIDGTLSPWCNIHADLTDFQSSTPGLMMRGVLEHDQRWPAILDNAVASFTQRMCLVLFTPLAERTVVIDENVGGLGVPDISFALSDITDRLEGCTWTVEQFVTATAYGAETIIKARK
jgi:hypothetical protein